MTEDVYRFVVVYRRVRADTPGDSDQWRGRVLPVPDLVASSRGDVSRGFTELSEVPDIIRDCMTVAIEKSRTD